MFLRPVAGLPSNAELVCIFKYVFFHTVDSEGFTKTGKVFLYVDIPVVSQILSATFSFPQLVQYSFIETIWEGFFLQHPLAQFVDGVLVKVASLGQKIITAFIFGFEFVDYRTVSYSSSDISSSLSVFFCHENIM